jgi:hypothetical protein
VTDVRAILEEESRSLRERDAWTKGIALIIALIILSMRVPRLIESFHIGALVGTIFPILALMGAAAAYTPRHREALREAIEDPDPALDPHFAAALTATEEDVAALGRKAFLQRFKNRLPVLDDIAWLSVAKALPHATVDEAEKMLGLLEVGGTRGAIAPVETFATTTKTERLQTAARRALGDIRLRTARNRIVASSKLSDAANQAERERLNLRN